MLDEKTIDGRLAQLRHDSPPQDVLWPENCAGSGNALVIFVGPSPGGGKGPRRPIREGVNRPLWGSPYRAPLNWSRGFQANFKPLVEAIFGRKYEDSGKLIARVNLDWVGNPESRDVPREYMKQGFAHVLPVIRQCEPSILIAMDRKTFRAIREGLEQDGWDDLRIRRQPIKVKASRGYHRNLYAFPAQKEGKRLGVVRCVQNPARMIDPGYGQRVGEAIGNAVEEGLLDS